jgi:hypothetical protein
LTISSSSERSGNASCGVGEARSIDDGSDSITLQKRRGLAWMRGCPRVHERVHSPCKRSRRFSFK